MAELLGQEAASFTLEAEIKAGQEDYRYRIEIKIEPLSGRLSVADEYLALLTAKGEPKGRPAVERVDKNLHIRRKSKPAHPRQESIGANHSMLSDQRLGGNEYRWLEAVRQELSDWRTYYLDPRVAMRSAQPPSDVRDIGLLGGDIAPFLYKLRAEEPKRFEAIRRTLRSLVPNVEDLAVDLDKRRGTLDLWIRQGGVDYSSRIVSEGTLRVLALCAIAVNPWSGSVLAFEEPENGVRPRRLELIASLLCWLATEPGRQVIVTTHSPLFCDAIQRQARSAPDQIGLFQVGRDHQTTFVQPFEAAAPLTRFSTSSGPNFAVVQGPRDRPARAAAGRELRSSAPCARYKGRRDPRSGPRRAGPVPHRRSLPPARRA